VHGSLSLFGFEDRHISNPCRTDCQALSLKYVLIMLWSNRFSASLVKLASSAEMSFSHKDSCQTRTNIGTTTSYQIEYRHN
jgi:hypothetical protein